MTGLIIAIQQKSYYLIMYDELVVHVLRFTALAVKTIEWAKPPFIRIVLVARAYGAAATFRVTGSVVSIISTGARAVKM